MRRGHVAVRMCVVCKKRDSKHKLVRHVRPLTVGERLMVDDTQCLPGRGWYVCNALVCQEKFQKFCFGKRNRQGAGAQDNRPALSQ